MNVDLWDATFNTIYDLETKSEEKLSIGDRIAIAQVRATMAVAGELSQLNSQLSQGDER